MTASVGDLSDADLHRCGITRLPPDEAGEVVWIDRAGYPVPAGRQVVVPDPPQFSLLFDQRTVKLPAGIPTQPVRYHRSAKVWQPTWFTVHVTGDGTVERAELGGPVLRLDGETYADGAWEHLTWRLLNSGTSLNPPVVWPADAPPVAVQAMRWLLETDPRLRLPVQPRKETP